MRSYECLWNGFDTLNTKELNIKKCKNFWTSLSKPEFFIPSVKSKQWLVVFLAQSPMQSWFQVLDLRGNPLTSVLRYRENVIGACGYLTTIDGKTVEAQSRVLMVNMRKMRLKKSGSSMGSSGSSGSERSSAGSVSNTLASSSAEHSSSSQLLPNVVPSDIEPPSPAKSDSRTSDRRKSDIVINNDKEDDDDEIYDSADDDDESVSEAQEYDPEAVETAAADDFSSKNIKEERWCKWKESWS